MGGKGFSLPEEPNDLLRTLAQGQFHTNHQDDEPKPQAEPLSQGPSVLAPGDEEYLQKLLALLRSGKRAVFIVEAEDSDRLKYMFSNASRGEAVSMLGKVLEATGKRVRDNEE